jgi:probable HAF family extracellular repeat protein
MKFLTIDDPNADQDPNFFDGTSIEAINNSGVVVGEYGNNGNQYGFYDFLGSYTTLFPPGAAGRISATGINDVGQIAGYYDWGPGVLGFMYSGGVYTNVQAPDAHDTYIRAINNSGVMVGYWVDDQAGDIHAFRATGADKNDFTEISVPGAKYAIAYGINNAGDIVGWFNDSKSNQHGYIEHNGTFTVLDDPLATNGTRVTAINDQGQIIGWYNDDSGSHAFLHSGGVFTTVTNIIGGKDFGIASINDRGMIAGSYSDAAGNHGFIGFPTIQPDNFNGDNFSDMLWRNASGALSDWTMNGATIAGSSSVTLQGNAVAPDTSWKIAGTSDFNNDSKTDLLWRQDSGSLALWLMNGSTITSSNAVTYQGNPIMPDASWSVAGIGDFNRDGNADILWRQSSGALAIWQMNGSAVQSSAPITYQGNVVAPDASWKVVEIGDFNGDGNSDILWRNDNG